PNDAVCIPTSQGPYPRDAAPDALMTREQRNLMRYSSVKPVAAGARPALRRGLDEGAIDPELLRLVPRHLAERHGLVPLAREDQSLALAMANPDDLLAIDEIHKLTGCRIQSVPASSEEITRAITRFYAGEMAADAVEAPSTAEESSDEILRLDAQERELAP